jgi:hypothetical protein
MPAYEYAPGKPWNESYSYAQYDTCTYKGLLYTCMHEDGSTGGKPNVSMSNYEAVQPPDDPVTYSDRTWALGDFIGFSDAFGYAGMTPSVRAGSVRNLQLKLRGISGITFGVTDDYAFENAKYFNAAYPGYHDPSGTAIGFIKSATYYEQKGGGQSYEYGVFVDNPSPDPDFPAYNGNGNVVEYAVNDLTAGGFRHPQDGVVDTSEPGLSMTQDAGVATVRAIPFVSQPSGVATFNKELAYTMNATQTDTSTTPPTVTNFTVSGTANTGDVRDNWYDQTTSTPTVHSYPDSGTVTTVFSAPVISSVTPRMDA